MVTWSPSDGYFGNLMAALRGQATRRVAGNQNSGGGGGTGGGQVVNADSALKLSAVWACVQLISEAVGTMPVKVWGIESDGSKVDRSDHWLHGLLNKSPNRYQTRNEFFETVIINLMLSGNSYVRVDRDPGGNRIVALLSLPAGQVSVPLSKSGDRTYVFTDGNNVEALAQESVWHLPLMPSNSVIGLSPLQYGARSMGIAIAAEDRVGSLASSGFKPTGVMMIDTKLNPDQRQQIREQFADLQEGQGDPLKVLEAGMTYQQITMSPKDVQLLESRRFSIEDICRFYGVPSVMVNDTGASTVWGTGISEIKEGFYTLKLQPLLEKIEASIVRWLIPAGERDRISVEFDFSRFLRGNDSKRVETAVRAISGNLLTIDEARKRFDGLPPLPDGLGSTIYAQSQMIPIGSGGETNDNP